MPDAAAISSISQAQVQQDVAFAVARKALDQQKAQGDAVVSLLQSAVEIQQATATKRPHAPGQTIHLYA